MGQGLWPDHRLSPRHRQHLRSKTAGAGLCQGSAAAGLQWERVKGSSLGTDSSGCPGSELAKAGGQQNQGNPVQPRFCCAQSPGCSQTLLQFLAGVRDPSEPMMVLRGQADGGQRQFFSPLQTLSLHLFLLPPHGPYSSGSQRSSMPSGQHAPACSCLLPARPRSHARLGSVPPALPSAACVCTADCSQHSVLPCTCPC